MKKSMVEVTTQRVIQKRKLLPEFDDEALEPTQSKNETTNRPDQPPCDRDGAANKATHKSTHDLREDLRQNPV